MIMIVESFQNKLGLILQYNNNLSQLKDTIHFGFDFNPLINNGISTNSLQAIGEATTEGGAPPRRH